MLFRVRAVFQQQCRDRSNIPLPHQERLVNIKVDDPHAVRRSKTFQVIDALKQHAAE